MNFRFVILQLGLIFGVLAAALLAVACWSGIEAWITTNDSSTNTEWYACISLVMSAGISAVMGGIMWIFTRRNSITQFGRREALLMVGLSWLVGAAIAGLPFFIWAHLINQQPVILESFNSQPHIFNSFIDCYFEAMSGLTTTGATVLTHIGNIPQGILLWRATTHWLGGLGIVVLFVAVLPSLGVGGKKLFRVETPGPTPEGVRPQIGETARILWLIYLGMTIAEIIALKLAGMNWFDSVCHTFATLATGGFSTSDASVGGYKSSMIDTIIIVFMVLAGVNFALYYQLIQKRFNVIWKDTELRVYIIILLLGSIIMFLSLTGNPVSTTDGQTINHASMPQALRYGVFTSVSVQTTTGFCNADFNKWPLFAQGTLLLLMFIGSSAGSTGGGIKVIRLVIAIKVMASEIERSFRPNVIRSLKIANIQISPELRQATLAYIIGVVIIFVAGTGLLLFIETDNAIDFRTAISASAATLFNVGPGLSRVGAIENYAWFHPISKIIMSILMAIGRLEVFAIVVLFTPRFWRGD